MRILLYLAGDFFTLFLSELIFWPLELVVEQSAERTAEADYNEINRLGHFRAMKRRNRSEVINVGSGSYPLLPGASESVEGETIEWCGHQLPEVRRKMARRVSRVRQGSGGEMRADRSSITAAVAFRSTTNSCAKRSCLGVSRFGFNGIPCRRRHPVDRLDPHKRRTVSTP